MRPAQGDLPASARRLSQFWFFRFPVVLPVLPAWSRSRPILASYSRILVEVSANIGQLQPNISFGYGFTAIIVAFLARLNPMGVIIAGLVVALAEMGGDAAQIAMGIPKVVTGVFKGILLFMLLAGETFNRYHVEFRLPGAAARAAAKEGSGA